MIRYLLLAAVAAGFFISGAALSQEAPAVVPSNAGTHAAPAPATHANTTVVPANAGTHAAPAPAPTVRTAVAPQPGAAPAATSLLQTILALLVVLGTLLGLAWALKRFGPRHVAGRGNLQVVGALNLGGRERIVVVEVGEQWIVVGASPGRINALATLPRQEGIAAAQREQEAAPNAPNFAQWLKQTIEKRNAK